MNDYSTDSKYQKLHIMPTAHESGFFRNLGYGVENKVKKSQIEKITENWKSGITVGLVHLPVSISLAVASGSTPIVGIISAIMGGIVSGIFGGSNYNIIGPSGGLAGFLAIGVSSYGPGVLPYYCFVVSFLIYLVKYFGLAEFIDMFPTAVNEGFSLGIALIMFIGQMNNFLGIGKIVHEVHEIDTETGEIVKILENSPDETTIKKAIDNILNIGHMNVITFIIFLVFFFGLIYLMKNYPKVPWMMISAVLGIMIGYTGIRTDTVGSKFSNLNFRIFDFSYLTSVSPLILIDPRFWADCIPVAFVCNLETLISAKLADGMTNTKFHRQRELRGLCLTNLFCGIFGSMPISGGIARTSFNIKLGATHKYSAAWNGLTVLILASVFMKVFSYIPIAVVSAQVCIIAYRMINFPEIEYLKEHDRTSFFVLIFISIVCIIKDAMNGIIFGMLIYLIFFCKNLTKTWTEIIVVDDKKESGKPIRSKSGIFSDESHIIDDMPQENGSFLIYRIIGSITFMNTNEHLDKIRSILRADKTVVISLKYVHFIDNGAINALKDLFNKIEKEFKKMDEHYDPNKKSKILLTGINPNKLAHFVDNEWIKSLVAKNALKVSEVERSQN